MDFISAIRIDLECDIATLPLTVAKADHTFDVSLIFVSKH
jgi:hypothetical protein